MHELAPIPAAATKEEVYRILVDSARHLIDGEHDLIANTANLSSLIAHTLPDLNWAGFYFEREGELVLGPFQGKPACIRITIGKGVCGVAAQRRETVIVQNVNEFPGHIACDSASNAEIVVPLIKEDTLIGVLDLDSPTIGRFDDEDRRGLEDLVKVLMAS